MIEAKQRLDRLTLETSLKPFTDLSPEAIEATCHQIWRNWARLIDRSDDLAILLWVGSGDEIFTYAGNDEDPVPWANNIGFNNLRYQTAYDPTIEHYPHNAAQPYRDPPPDLRYRHLKQIIETLKTTGEQIVGKQPMIGATIDPGPEFADSPWRYEKHPEVLQEKLAKRQYPMQFFTHQATLHADDSPYAALPAGIPEGMRIGTLLGKQFEATRTRLGFDYLWLSNGLGYSHHPWIFRGHLFDGDQFFPKEAENQRQQANQFWKDLRAETDCLIDVRGTNFTVGMDISTDGCSHEDIFQIGGLPRPPCNPPWGSRALGLEMAVFLSRIAKTPTDRLPFRFYLNDPWFASTPWYDYYGRLPFDVYTPMAASRMNDDGGVDSPTDLNLLTIDTSHGQLLEDEAGEFTPHMLEALDTRADSAGPVVWVYPFDEYERMLKEGSGDLDLIFANDWFMGRAIDGGLPVSTVCSADRFVQLQQAGRLPEAVYVLAVPVGETPTIRAALAHVETGGRILLYGPTADASARLLNMLDLAQSKPIEGVMKLETTLPGDAFEAEAQPPVGVNPFDAAVGMEDQSSVEVTRIEGELPIIHRSVTSGGPITASAATAEDVCATVEVNGDRRTYAMSRADESWQGGRLAWLRSTVDLDPTTPRHEPAWDPPGRTKPVAELARHLLSELGWTIRQQRHDESVGPAHVFFKRAANLWYLLGHKRDTTARFWVSTPDGAPIYEEAETPIRNGLAGENFGKWFHQRIVAFVQMPDGIARCKRQVVPVGRRYHCSITDLVDADLTIYIDTSACALEDVLVRPELRHGEVKHTLDHDRGAIHVQNYTGTLFVCW